MTTQHEPNHHPNISKVVTKLQLWQGGRKRARRMFRTQTYVDGRYKFLYLALELTDALEACTAENLNTNYYIMPDPMCRQKLSKVKA